MLRLSVTERLYQRCTIFTFIRKFSRWLTKTDHAFKNTLITSVEGQLAWNDNDVSLQTMVDPMGVAMNRTSALSAVGHDYISDFKALVSKAKRLR